MFVFFSLNFSVVLLAAKAPRQTVKDKRGVPLVALNWRQQLLPLHRPVDQQLRFFPPRIHRLALQHHHDYEVAIFLEAARQAGAGSLGYSCLHAGEAVDSEQAICVHPVVRVLVILENRFILFFRRRLLGRFLAAAIYILTSSRLVRLFAACFGGRRLRHWNWPLDSPTGSALVGLGAHNFAKERDLHANGRQAANVIRSGHILLVHQAVRTVEEAVHEFKRSCVVVHLLEEVLYEVRVVVELVRTDPLHVFLVVPFLFEDKATKVLGKDEGCVVSRRKHRAVEQFLRSENVALFELRGGAPDVRTDAANGDFCLV